MAQIDTDYSDARTLIMSLLLIATSFITNIAAHLVEYYDMYFKLLTLLSLTLVVLINIGKAFKMVLNFVIEIKKYIKRCLNND